MIMLCDLCSAALAKLKVQTISEVVSLALVVVVVVVVTYSVKLIAFPDLSFAGLFPFAWDFNEKARLSR